MKRKGLGVIRDILKQIHPPLPLEQRETQRLQHLLSSSFRKRLDEEHPHGDASQSRITDAHVLRILASPLLRAQRRDAASGSHLSGGTSLVSDLQSALCSPIDKFQEKVVIGEATLKSAAGMLQAYVKWLRLPSDQLEPSTAKEPADALNIALHWIWSSGLEESFEVFHDYNLVNLLVTFLVRFEKDDIIWRWLAKLNTRLACSTSRWEQKTVSDAMLHLIFQHCKRKYNLTHQPDEAIAIMMKAWGQYGFKSHSQDPFDNILRKIPFIHLRNRAWPSVRLSEEMYMSLTTNSELWTRASERTKAGFALLAPTPDPYPAWNYLRAIKSSTQVPNASKEERHTLILLDATARALRAQGEDTDADTLANMFSHKTLPRTELFGVKRASRPDTNEDEADQPATIVRLDTA